MLTYKCTTKHPIRVREVQFGLLSSEEMRRMSTVNIKDTTIYYRGLPNPYGINDHRMGTVDRRLFCGTCGKDVKTCQGHVGHIELSFPMYNIGMFDTVFKMLRCVCYMCSRVLLTEEEIRHLPEDDGKTRFNAVYAMLKSRKRCACCGLLQPNYSRLSLSIRIDWPNDMEWESQMESDYCTRPFTQRDALSILKRITDEDCAVLGFNPELCHPKNMIMQVILVPPPVARPAIMASEGSRSRGQDDLTHKLQDINKRSIELGIAMDGKRWSQIEITPDLMERIHKLQFEVFTYMNNNIRGQKQSTQRSGAPTKSIIDRLKGKDGRIRGNLMGKRVDFSARSVITPDSVMDVDQVGIPYKVAMTLTIPERVNSTNIEKLTQRVHNGPNDIFGAETVITNSGVMIHLSTCDSRDKIRLQYGWIVERFLADNDFVIFNRQPSLHKVGMMGHRVKLMHGSTFRLNLCCANPYNADFDGDEMNLHVPQSPAAIADVAMLMMVPQQIISPQANRPVMGIVQDTLLGAYLFSAIDVLINKSTACHIVSLLRYSPHRLPPPCIVYPKELWSGKQLLSHLLPPNMRVGVRPHAADVDPNDKKVCVFEGQIITGVLSKATLGTSASGFVDTLFRHHGSMLTIRWMSDIQRLINAWLALRGFAVGVKDCVISPKGEDRVRKRIERAMFYAEQLIGEPVADSNEKVVLESTIVRMLSKTLMQTGSIVDEELDKDNAIRKMVNAGSKGTPINLSQICGCVGQQSIEGHRVFAEKGGRTLSCFDFVDNSLSGQGFVQNSYALGLHPWEYFFHAMGGREGLVDTAVKTATTGYIQRRQMKSMEDHKVYTDGTVRNAEEFIIDFSYGGDCMNPSCVERLRLRLLDEREDSLAARLRPWEFECALQCRKAILSCKAAGQALDTRVLLPFNPLHIVLRHKDGAPATEEQIEDRVYQYFKTTKSSVYRAAILDYLSVNTLRAAKLSLEEVDAIFEHITHRTEHARIEYGECVGSIAAQSIGEPCTQLTLNTFHFAGVSSKNVTLGIPRLKELLDYTKNIKTPCNTIWFKACLSTRRDFAQFFADTLPLTRLGDIVKECEIFYDPNPQTTNIENDTFMVHMDYELSEWDDTASLYIIRLVLNQEIMKCRYITPPMVRHLLQNRLRGKAHIVSSETNDIDWIVRIRLVNMRDIIALLSKSYMSANDTEGLLCHRIISVLMDTIAISGHIGITGAQIREVEIEEQKHYVVDTQGCSLIDLSAASCIDWHATTSNDINEVHTTLGLEAAVNVLYSELTTTISFDGTYVDPRHIMMVVNTMTRGGYIMPLSRHGINRMDSGPLKRCSFEETPDILFDAAMYAQFDNGQGVSQNIMTGMLPCIGTGAMTISMAPHMMHPRDVCTDTKTPSRVLKSSVRVRNTPAHEIDYMDVEANKHTFVPSNEWEAPFKEDAGDMHSTNEAIFSTPFVQLPYLSEKDTVHDSASRIALHQEYRPSSPSVLLASSSKVDQSEDDSDMDTSH